MYDPLAESVSVPSPTRKVSNVLPTIVVPYRLAIIGEAPGQDEETYKTPFVGASGRLLDSVLNSVGILRAGCFVGNICKYRPPGNEIKNWGYKHPAVLDGWSELQAELKSYEPNCILALGNTPLHFITGRNGILNWRGSILWSAQGKVVPAIHPAAVLREYKLWPLLRFDTIRARQEASTKGLVLPQRNIEINLTSDEICNRLDKWRAGELLSFDIEGGLDAFPCCSVAGRADHGFTIAWSKHSTYDQGRIAVALSRLLYRNDVPKVLQNSLYDRFVLAYAYNMHIRNVREDTMLKHWEIYPESSVKEKVGSDRRVAGIGKGLGVIASIWTREPYYKYERKTDDPDILLKYCGKDSCVTIEAAKAMSDALSSDALRHYNFNMDLLSPLLYMELRGFRYDQATATQKLNEVRSVLAETSSRLTIRAGYSLTGAQGSISATKLKKCLYKEQGYPAVKVKVGKEYKDSTNVEALLQLYKRNPNDPFIQDILLHRKLEGIKETLEIAPDSDGRVRCGYNLVGTETGRLACYTSPTGSGSNLQTITEKLRLLYLANEDHWIIQCDLRGADGWTVAARCLQFGDGTMWEDYNYGLRPADIIVLIYTHGWDIVRCTRDELKDRCKSIDPKGWLPFGCKRIFHSTNYGVKWKTGVAQIAADAYKKTGRPIFIDRETYETIQGIVLRRYSGVPLWQEWCGRQVESGKNLKSASGHTRIFFGRRKSWNIKNREWSYDHETWKEYLADEPQENTTYATNKALHNLWTDKDNRIVSSQNGKVGGLYIEPLHHNHDALITQCRKEHLGWAITKHHEWFKNEIEVGSVRFTIPFDGKYGRSWGELTEGKI